MDETNQHPANSGEMDRAYTEKQERLARRRKYLKIGGAALLLLVGLFTLPIPLGTLKIVGSDKVTVQDVEVAGDISEPVNILRINTEKLKTQLSHDLRVEEAHVSYELPLTMVVRIVERKAIAVVPAQFGYLTLDKSGQVIKAEDAIEDTAVPIISGVKGGNILLGDMVHDEPIVKALEYLRALDDSTFNEIAEINVGDPNNLLAYTVSGIQIRLGDGTELKQKADLTSSMLNDLAKSRGNVQYIDVNPNSPFIKTDAVVEKGR